MAAPTSLWAVIRCMRVPGRRLWTLALASQMDQPISHQSEPQMNGGGSKPSWNLVGISHLLYFSNTIFKRQASEFVDRENILQILNWIGQFGLI